MGSSTKVSDSGDLGWDEYCTFLVSSQEMKLVLT